MPSSIDHISVESTREAGSGDRGSFQPGSFNTSPCRPFPKHSRTTASQEATIHSIIASVIKVALHILNATRQYYCFVLLGRGLFLIKSEVVAGEGY